MVALGTHTRIEKWDPRNQGMSTKCERPGKSSCCMDTRETIARLLKWARYALVHQPKRVNVPSSIPSMLCMYDPSVSTMQNGSMLLLLLISSFVSPLLLKSFFFFFFFLCLMLEPRYCWKYALEAIINGYYCISLFMIIVYCSCYNCVNQKP